MSDKIRDLLSIRRLDPADEIGVSQTGPRKGPRRAPNAQLLAPATEDMMQAGAKGGSFRTAIKKERTHVHGRPPAGQRARMNKDGELEVYEPRDEYDARESRT